MDKAAGDTLSPTCLWAGHGTRGVCIPWGCAVRCSFHVGSAPVAGGWWDCVPPCGVEQKRWSS